MVGGNGTSAFWLSAMLRVNTLVLGHGSEGRGILHMPVGLDWE